MAFFGSAAGPFGNRGQSDYAAANELLNKLAMHLGRSWPGRVVSVSWGPWQKTGMVSAELQREFARRGIELISIPAGCRIFDQEIRHGANADSEVIVMRSECDNLILQHRIRSRHHADHVVADSPLCFRKLCERIEAFHETQAAPATGRERNPLEVSAVTGRCKSQRFHLGSDEPCGLVRSTGSRPAPFHRIGGEGRQNTPHIRLRYRIGCR